MKPTSVQPTNGLDMKDLGKRIRLERSQRCLSLEALAEQAGVSRSMLSEVERGAKVPTVLVLDRIATGLDTSIARLLGEERFARVLLRRRDEQDMVRDPSGWERRILSPVLPGIEFEFMRTMIPPGINAGTFSPHAPGSREYLAMESGILLLTINGTAYTLCAGDSIYYAGDCIHTFVNPGKKPCTYYLAMDVTRHSTKVSYHPTLPKSGKNHESSHTPHESFFSTRSLRAKG